MARSRWVLMLAIPLGFVAGHAGGYLLAPPDEADQALDHAAHGYFGSLSRVAVPLFLASLLCALLNGARGRDLTVRFRSLAVQLTAVFLTIEVVEHLASGATLPHIFGEHSLYWGLAAQLLVAAALIQLLRLTHRVGRHFHRAAPPVARRRLPFTVPPALDIIGAVALTSISTRGPPLRA